MSISHQHLVYDVKPLLWQDVNVMHFPANATLQPWLITYLKLMIKVSLNHGHMDGNIIFTRYFQQKESALYVASCIEPRVSHTCESAVQLAAPCGHIQHIEDPLIFGKCIWTITAWKESIINITFGYLNLPASVNCIKAHLEIMDEKAVSNVNWCGRSKDKSFYSSGNEVSVKLIKMASVVDVTRYIPISIDFTYQVHDWNILHTDNAHNSAQVTPDGFITIKGLSFKYNWQHFLIYHIYSHLLFTIQLNITTSKCSDTDHPEITKIFDGPSSKSHLIKEIKCHKQNSIFTMSSSLSYITVYMTGDGSSADKINNISYISVPHDIAQESIDVNSSHISFMSHINENNIFLVWMAKSYPGRFVNLNLTLFQYDGNTENVCIYAGLFFITSNSNFSYGPLCGVFGHSAFRLQEGLTFDSNQVYIVLYKYSNSGLFSFSIQVSSTECEGILSFCARPLSTIKSDILSKKNNKLYSHLEAKDGTCVRLHHLTDPFNTPRGCISNSISSGPNSISAYIGIAFSLYHEGHCNHSEEYLRLLFRADNKMEELKLIKTYETCENKLIKLNITAFLTTWVVHFEKLKLYEDFSLFLQFLSIGSCVVQTWQDGMSNNYRLRLFYVTNRCFKLYFPSSLSGRFALSGISQSSPIIQISVKINTIPCDEFDNFLLIYIASMGYSLVYSWILQKGVTNWTINMIGTQQFSEVFLHIFIRIKPNTIPSAIDLYHKYKQAFNEEYLGRKLINSSFQYELPNAEVCFYDEQFLSISIFRKDPEEEMFDLLTGMKGVLNLIYNKVLLPPTW